MAVGRGSNHRRHATLNGEQTRPQAGGQEPKQPKRLACKLTCQLGWPVMYAMHVIATSPHAGRNTINNAATMDNTAAPITPGTELRPCPHTHARLDHPVLISTYTHHAVPFKG
jgi:hypothetical protein